ncbi:MULTISPECIES: ribosome small subunit-dependent GTPase A [Saccharibacillus]|uniref:Small ribosomal subunit biogenesis GTPase RsgA n=1 Tax=Saccharibacillus brassicae TaxID=2583377 RepID=A0A4Y6UTR4_SACBS|nr:MULTISPECIES: ribosome small subunit-dependent GTPase A [Saccharibacillus]MWJ32098.1 ribosome small subunit-dependent GTPase A [Saccharibacillus sp. WB 17]QDH19727.1 ribosome small subunit-dependent GTPase A [Saccharibacillus brassicae]
MPEGLIVKALSGYYYVKDNEASPGDKAIQCRARGLFRLKGKSPLVGDRVVYELTENGEGTVTELKPRTSELVRPQVANVNVAVLVFSVKEPDLSLNLLDKFLVHIENEGLEAIICFTKMDLIAEDDVQTREEVEQARALYTSIGYEVLETSSPQGLGADRLRERLAGEISVFSGQSGVGKSSLLNAMFADLDLLTSEISLRLGRGRHTTRHVELVDLGSGGYIADTPGFSQLDFLELGVDELPSCFREFAALADGCKFRGCTHLHEPQCKVREALERGEIAESRYKHYKAFYQEMKDKKRRY